MAGDLLRLTVRCDEFAPAIVREAISRLPDVGWIVGDVMLVASELVTNAVRHSACRGDDLVSVRVGRDGSLRIVVIDPGASGETAQIAERPAAIGGMGLTVVATLASRWGAERDGEGYKVWAAIPLPT